MPEPGNPQEFNRYSYVLNNPLKYVDPSGHLTESSVQGEVSRKEDKYAGLFQEYPYARELYKQILKLESEGSTPYGEGEEWVERQYSSQEEFQRNDKRLALGSASSEFSALANKYGVCFADDPSDLPGGIFEGALTTIPFAAAGPLAGAVGKLAGANVKFVTTPNGTTVPIPEGWESRVADNGKGIVYQRPGATGNADMIRIMEPTPHYSEGYVRYYNSYGQPLDVNGMPGSRATTHIPINYQGPIPGWPK